MILSTLQVLLCSLRGDIFPKALLAQAQLAGCNAAKHQHLAQMLGLVGVWMGDPQAAVHQAAANEEAPLLEGCRSASQSVQFRGNMPKMIWVISRPV